MEKTTRDMEVKNWYVSGFKDFETKLNGESGTFLHLIRKIALEKLNDAKFPTMKDEEWKYTSVAPILKHDFLPAFTARKISVKPEDLEGKVYTGFDCYKLVFANGEYVEELSDLEGLPENVTAGSIRQIINDKPGIVEKYVNKNISHENAFNLLNEAYATDGVFVHVPKGVAVDKPFQVIFLGGNKEQKVMAAPHNIFAGEENSQFSVLTNYTTIEDNVYFSNILTEVFLEKHAVMDLYKLQNESETTFHIERAEVTQAETSVFSHYNVTFGGALVRNDINTELKGEYCQSNLYGMYFGSDNQHIDNHSFVNHAKPNCESNELYKGILDDKSRGVFNGKIYVRKDAQKTNAYQSNKTILLSDDARIDTKPQLEIYADDVKCSHGATIGHLDETAYFYIISRGIPADHAKSMLIRAFADDVISKIKIEPLRKQVNKQIFEHLRRVEV